MTGCTSWPASSPEKRRASPSSTPASCSPRPSQPIPASGRQCKLLPMPKFRSAARTDIGMKGDHAIVGHVGDSRAYLVRDGQVWQLSEDHSLVNEQVRAGLLTEEEAKHSRLKNIITRSVGFEEDVLVDVVGVETRSGDKFLLCSDGLSNLIDNDEIRDALVQTELDQVPEMLIQLANSRGGDDNITVIAVHRVE